MTAQLLFDLAAVFFLEASHAADLQEQRRLLRIATELRTRAVRA